MDSYERMVGKSVRKEDMMVRDPEEEKNAILLTLNMEEGTTVKKCNWSLETKWHDKEMGSAVEHPEKCSTVFQIYDLQNSDYKFMLF